MSPPLEGGGMKREKSFTITYCKLHLYIYIHRFTAPWQQAPPLTGIPAAGPDHHVGGCGEDADDVEGSLVGGSAGPTPHLPHPSLHLPLTHPHQLPVEGSVQSCRHRRECGRSADRERRESRRVSLELLEPGER